MKWVPVCGLFLIALFCRSGLADPGGRGHSGGHGHPGGHGHSGGQFHHGGSSWHAYGGSSNAWSRSRLGFAWPLYGPSYSNYYYSYTPGFYGYGGAAYGFGMLSPWGYNAGIDYYSSAPQSALAARRLLILPPARQEPIDPGDFDLERRDLERRDLEPDRAPQDRERRNLEPPLVIRARPRETLPAARQRCLRFVELGDQFFIRQQYEDALRQYKSAAAAAPGMALPLVRQMVAYVATRRYDSALKACRRSVAIEPTYMRGDFQLASLYGDQRAAKNSHLETLASRAFETPNDATPLVLLGLMFYFDGDHERADRFLKAASELLPRDDEILAVFGTLPDPPNELGPVELDT